jgi:hypothetical protein
MGPVIGVEDAFVVPTFRMFHELANEYDAYPAEGSNWRDAYRAWMDGWSGDVMEGGDKWFHRSDILNHFDSQEAAEALESVGYAKRLKNGDLVLNPKYADRILDSVFDPTIKGEAPYASGGPVGALGRCCSAMAEGGPFVGYVTGPGGGQDDLVQARLSPGEYVFDADSVAALGDGSNEEGARRLDAMREQIRAHKRSAPPEEIPPMAAAPAQYLMGGQ